MKAFIDWHKKYVEWWKKKLKISNYGIFWISFIKGLIIGLLIYHFFIQIMKKLLGILVLGLKHYLLHLKGYARIPSENSV